MKGKRGRGTADSDKPPILGLIERGGKLVCKVLDNVQQKTIQPIFERLVRLGSTVNTDEYTIYDRLESWGYTHVSVNHGSGEFARDADGDGINEVHVNTLEGVWSLLRSWLRPHRGVSQRWLPVYVGFFSVIHNLRRRGRAVLGPLLHLLLNPTPRYPY